MVDIDSKTLQRNQKMPKTRLPPRFLDMPLSVANLVLEKLKPIDRLICRKVCRSLKNAVDKFGIHFDKISFRHDDKSYDDPPWSRLAWNRVPVKNAVSLNLDYDEFYYFEEDNGDMIVQKQWGPKKIFNGESSVTMALRDLVTAMNKTRRFRIMNLLNDNPYFLSLFTDALKTVKNMEVKRIDFCRLSFNSILSILPYFNAKFIEHISMDYCIIKKFKRVASLDQWKNVKTVEITDLKNNAYFSQIELLFHCKQFKIDMDHFPPQKAVKIREDLLTRSTFQKCIIHTKSNTIRLAKVFKPDFTGEDRYKIEYSNNNATFTIECPRGFFRFDRKSKFVITRLSS